MIRKGDLEFVLFSVQLGLNDPHTVGMRKEINQLIIFQYFYKNQTSPIVKLRSIKLSKNQFLTYFDSLKQKMKSPNYKKKHGFDNSSFL